MKIEDQTCSLELAKKLKELGVKQESVFKYCGGHTMYDDHPDGKFETCENTDLLDPRDEYCHTAGLTCEFTICAFTVAELGEMLPDGASSFKANRYHVWNTKMQTWTCDLPNTHPARHAMQLRKDPQAFFGDTEADARAKMLIYLIEQVLLDPKTLSV